MEKTLTKWSRIFGTALVVVALLGCLAFATACTGEGSDEGSGATTEEAVGSAEATDADEAETQYADEAFVEDLGAALSERWAITESYDDEIPDDEFYTALQIEKDAAAQYEDAVFVDEELGEAAEQYLEAIADCETADYIDVNDTYIDAYYRRAEGIYKINQITEIPVDEDYQYALDTLLEEGESSCAATEFAEEVVFEADEPEDGDGSTVTYTATLENTSDVDFDYFSFEINLLDEDGVVIGSETASTDNWAAGETHRFEFTVFEDVEDIADYEIVDTTWSD